MARGAADSSNKSSLWPVQETEEKSRPFSTRWVAGLVLSAGCSKQMQEDRWLGVIHMCLLPRPAVALRGATGQLQSVGANRLRTGALLHFIASDGECHCWKLGHSTYLSPTCRWRMVLSSSEHSTGHEASWGVVTEDSSDYPWSRLKHWWLQDKLG